MLIPPVLSVGRHLMHRPDGFRAAAALPFHDESATHPRWQNYKSNGSVCQHKSATWQQAAEKRRAPQAGTSLFLEPCTYPAIKG